MHLQYRQPHRTDRSSDSLREMRGELAPEETELRELTDSALGKLQAMSDAEFAELELYPDFDQ